MRCREVRLVAQLLYSGLTTGAGLQTLGEEYCDIIQSAGSSWDLVVTPVIPSMERNSLQVGSSLCRVPKFL